MFLSTGMEKGNKYNQDQSSIMLLAEHNFRHNAVVLMVTCKSIMHKFSSIMYLTLTCPRTKPKATNLWSQSVSQAGRQAGRQSVNW